MASIFNKAKDFKKTLFVPIEGVLSPEEVTQQRVCEVLQARGIEAQIDEDEDIIGSSDGMNFVISTTYTTYASLHISSFWYLKDTAPYLVAINMANAINDGVVFVRARVVNASNESEQLCLSFDASVALDGGITEDRIDAFVRRFIATTKTAVEKFDTEGIIA